MKRRDFSIQLAGIGLGAALARPALAQSPVEGTHYIKLSQPLPANMLPPAGKIDVAEFFWYECPHCNAFEPMLEAWAKRLPADVSLRRVHVGFGPMHQLHQRLYYALEETGLVDQMHRKVFAAIHLQGKRLGTEAEIRRFLEDSGVDATKVMTAFKSFSVDTKVTRAKQLTDAYKIDGVPAMGVQGRYYTSGSLTGSLERMLEVAAFLVQRVRKGKN